MTDKKFTDEEIIKALECCRHPLTKCGECPYKEWRPFSCFDDAKTDAIDLINRQNAEIEELKEIVFMDRSEAIKKLKSEAIKEFAERLKSKINCIPQHRFTLAEVLFDLDKLVKEMTEK